MRAAAVVAGGVLALVAVMIIFVRAKNLVEGKDMASRCVDFANNSVHGKTAKAEYINEVCKPLKGYP